MTLCCPRYRGSQGLARFDNRFHPHLPEQIRQRRHRIQIAGAQVNILVVQWAGSRHQGRVGGELLRQVRVHGRAAVIAGAMGKPEQIVVAIEQKNRIGVRDNGRCVVAEQTGPKGLHRVGRRVIADHGTGPRGIRARGKQAHPAPQPHARNER